MIALALTAALALAAGDEAARPAAELDVTGSATCPSPAEISARLAELFPAGGWGRGRDAGARVVVTRDGAALHLALLGPDGDALAARDLAAEGSCGDLAAAAAVIVGAWRADLDPELTPAVRLAAPPPPPGAAAMTVVEAPPPPAPQPRAWAIGLGVLASESGGAIAPGAVLTGWVGLGRHVALDASVLGTASRSADVGAMPGVASWARGALALGPSLARRRERTRVSAHVQAVACLLRVRGVGLPQATADTTLEAGAAAGAKIELLTGTSALWLGVDAFVWPGDQRLIIENVSDQGHLSRFEIMASAGISLGRFQ